MKYATLLFVLSSLSALGQDYEKKKINNLLKANILEYVEKFKHDSCDIPTRHGVSYTMNKKVEKLIKDSVDLRDFDGVDVRMNIQVMGSCNGLIYIDRLYADDGSLNDAFVELAYRVCSEVSRLDIGPILDDKGVQYQPHYIGYIDVRNGKVYRISLN